METEAERESARKDAQNLTRRFGDLEEELRLKEKDYAMSVDEARSAERRISERLRTTENALDETKADLGDLKLKLSAAEGRVNGLESQLAQVEGKSSWLFLFSDYFIGTICFSHQYSSSSILSIKIFTKLL